MATVSEIKAAAEKEIKSRTNTEEWARAVFELRHTVPDWPEMLVLMANEIEELRAKEVRP